MITSASNFIHQLHYITTLGNSHVGMCKQFACEKLLKNRHAKRIFSDLGKKNNSGMLMKKYTMLHNSESYDGKN